MLTFPAITLITDRDVEEEDKMIAKVKEFQNAPTPYHQRLKSYEKDGESLQTSNLSDVN